MSSETCLERRKDGGWGWIVVAASIMSQVLVGGIGLSGGLFYVIFRNAFDSSPVETSWLCALPITIWFSCSPIGSFLTNKYGYRISAFIGGVLAGTGLCLGFFAPNIGFLYFSHGILTGVGFGINYTAIMTAVNVYFDKYKTVATGVISIGHNIGLVIYASFMVYLEERYGWRGAMLIHGAMIFNICFFALLLAPLTDQHASGSDLSVNAQEKDIETLSVKKQHKRKYIDLSVFRNSAFVCFCISNIMVNTSYGIFILHLPSYSKENGFTREEMGTVLAAYGITNLIGKVVYSALGQHPRIDITVVYLTSLMATAVFIVLTPVFVSRAGMLTLASCMGFFFAVTGALLAAVIFRIVGFDRFADGIGMAMPFKAFGNLIGGALGGFMYEAMGDYSSSFYLGGACMFIGSLLMIPQAIKLHRDEQQSKSNRNDRICKTEVDALTCFEMETTQSRENDDIVK